MTIKRHRTVLVFARSPAPTLDPSPPAEVRAPRPLSPAEVRDLRVRQSGNIARSRRLDRPRDHAIPRRREVSSACDDGAYSPPSDDSIRGPLEVLVEPPPGERRAGDDGVLRCGDVVFALANGHVSRHLCPACSPGAPFSCLGCEARIATEMLHTARRIDENSPEAS